MSYQLNRFWIQFRSMFADRLSDAGIPKDLLTTEKGWQDFVENCTEQTELVDFGTWKPLQLMKLQQLLYSMQEQGHEVGGNNGLLKHIEQLVVARLKGGNH